MRLNLATDVHYLDDGRAVAAGIAFADWASETIARTEVVHLDDVLPYKPGEFFERELPCLLALLARFDELPVAIVVDGFVTLGDEARDGLGAHLYAALDGRVPVLGVAKSRYVGTPPETEVVRGKSTRPLYVTACGLPVEDAKRLVCNMHGDHRIPTLLAAVDRACREAAGDC